MAPSLAALTNGTRVAMVWLSRLFDWDDALAVVKPVKVIKTPPRVPLANAHCERLNGTIRREFLDHVIPLSEEHLRRLLKEWTTHYNRERPHASLEPGLPNPRIGLPVEPLTERHRLPPEAKIVSTPILGGLHHEYRLSYADAAT